MHTQEQGEATGTESKQHESNEPITAKEPRRTTEITANIHRREIESKEQNSIDDTRAIQKQ